MATLNDGIKLTVQDTQIVLTVQDHFDGSIVTLTTGEPQSVNLELLASQGPQGIQGITGDTGVGRQGDTGVQGIDGDTGVSIKGDTGIATKGDTGVATTGDTGIQGIGGDTGIQGISGDTGIGRQGDTGNQGREGDTGIQGIVGDTGIQGIGGDTGIHGTQGDTGVSVKGDTGTAVTGDTGVHGTQGDTGISVKGDTGVAGTTVASRVSFTPYESITSTSVQGAIQELVDEKIPLSYLDTNSALGDSDTKIPSQKAVKTFGGNLIKYLNTSLSTTLLDGGTLTVNLVDPTTVDISAGIAIVCDNYADPDNASVKIVEWGDLTAQEDPFISDNGFTTWGIDSNGHVNTASGDFTDEDRRNVAVLGWTDHSDGPIQNFSYNQPYWGNNVYSQLVDLALAIGSFNISGNDIEPIDGLQIARSAGKVFEVGSNYPESQLSPNIFVSNYEGPVEMIYYYRTGVGVWKNSNDAVTLVDPNHYDTGTGLGDVPAGQYTIQVVTYYSSQNSLDVQYGQAHYATKEEALAASQVPNIEFNPYNSYDVVRCWLIVKQGATDLTDSSQATFIPSGRFGTVTGTGGGARGEINTASNAGLSGVGLYDSKIGVELRFKNIRAASNNVSVTLNSELKTIDIDANYIVNSGTTFPLTPFSGQRFIQNVTGRSVEYVYSGTDALWIPEIAHGNTLNLYVNSVTGVDDLEHGTSNENAFLTLHYVAFYLNAITHFSKELTNFTINIYLDGHFTDASSIEIPDPMVYVNLYGTTTLKASGTVATIDRSFVSNSSYITDTTTVGLDALVGSGELYLQYSKSGSTYYLLCKDFVFASVDDTHINKVNFWNYDIHGVGETDDPNALGVGDTYQIVEISTSIAEVHFNCSHINFFNILVEGGLATNGNLVILEACTVSGTNEINSKEVSLVTCNVRSALIDSASSSFSLLDSYFYNYSSLKCTQTQEIYLNLSGSYLDYGGSSGGASNYCIYINNGGFTCTHTTFSLSDYVDTSIPMVLINNGTIEYDVYGGGSNVRVVGTTLQFITSTSYIPVVHNATSFAYEGQTLILDQYGRKWKIVYASKTGWRIAEILTPETEVYIDAVTGKDQISYGYSSDYAYKSIEYVMSIFSNCSINYEPQTGLSGTTYSFSANEVTHIKIYISEGDYTTLASGAWNLVWQPTISGGNVSVWIEGSSNVITEGVLSSLVDTWSTKSFYLRDPANFALTDNLITSDTCISFTDPSYGGAWYAVACGSTALNHQINLRPMDMESEISWRSTYTNYRVFTPTTKLPRLNITLENNVCVSIVSCELYGYVAVTSGNADLIGCTTQSGDDNLAVNFNLNNNVWVEGCVFDTYDTLLLNGVFYTSINTTSMLHGNNTGSGGILATQPHRTNIYGLYIGDSNTLPIEVRYGAVLNPHKVVITKGTGSYSSKAINVDSMSTIRYNGATENVFTGYTVEISDQSFARARSVVAAGDTDNTLGFFGASPVAKPSITGDRYGIPAVTDLLSKLATQGLIVNSTTSSALPKGDTGVGVKGDTGVATKGDTGSTGGTGTAGAKGDTGVATKGDTGIGTTGSKGDTGSIGGTGTAGAKGDTGVGQKGDTGSTGGTGTIGAKGDTGVGTKGDTGVGTTGSKGDTGSIGGTGTAGAKGDTGVGTKGDTGIGTKGDTGIGTTGSKGDTGSIGGTGTAGAKGDTGVGIQGIKGDTGTSGGAGSINVVDTSIDYTLISTDSLLRCNASGGSLAITANAGSRGESHSILKVDASRYGVTLTATFTSGDTSLTIDMQGEVIDIISTGTTWDIV